MSETKHTPRSWKHRNGRIFHADREELTIAHVARAYDGDYSPANGDLLAAAPDLLAACEALEDRDCEVYGEGRTCPPNEYPTRCPVCLARTAIARAKGGE